MDCIVLSSSDDDEEDVQFIKVVKTPIAKSEEPDVIFCKVLREPDVVSEEVVTRLHISNKSCKNVGNLVSDLCSKHSKKDLSNDSNSLNLGNKEVTIKKVISHELSKGNHNCEDDDVQIIYESFSKTHNKSVKDVTKNISNHQGNLIGLSPILDKVLQKPKVKKSSIDEYILNTSSTKNDSSPVVDNRLSCTVRKCSTSEINSCDNEVEIISENFLVDRPKEKTSSSKDVSPSSPNITGKMVPNSLGIIISNTSESQNVTIIDNQSNSAKKKVQLTFLGGSRPNSSSNDSTPLVKLKDKIDKKLQESRRSPEEEKEEEGIKEENKNTVHKRNSEHNKKVVPETPKKVNSKPNNLEDIKSSIDKKIFKVDDVKSVTKNNQVKHAESSTSIEIESDSSCPSSPKTKNHQDIITEDDSLSDNESPKSCNARQLKLIRDKFNMFLNVCTRSVDSPAMEKAKSKLTKYYDLASEDHLLKQDFKAKLEGITNKLKLHKDINPFEYMKKILLYLKENSEVKENPKILKLEKVLKAVNKKIKQLEEAEVTSSDEENDNSYIMLDRYRKRAVQIFNKICELKEEQPTAERPFLGKFYFDGNFPETGSSSNLKMVFESAGHTLEKYYNKYRKFPDFHDVRSLVKKHCDQNSFTLSPDKLHFISEHLFVQFGHKLQKRRKCDDHLICSEYLPEDARDPAEHDEELSLKLKMNMTSRRSEKEVLDAFAVKQTELREKHGSEDINLSDGSSRSNSDDEGSKSSKKHKNKKVTENLNTLSGAKDGFSNIPNFSKPSHSLKEKQDCLKSDLTTFCETLELQRNNNKRKHGDDSLNGEFSGGIKRKKRSDEKLEVDKSSNNVKFTCDDDLPKSVMKRCNSSPTLDIVSANSDTDNTGLKAPLRKYFSANDVMKLCETEKIPITLLASNEKDVGFETYEICDSDIDDKEPTRKLSQEEIDELIPLVMCVDD